MIDSSHAPHQTDAEAMMAFVLSLRSKGIRDKRVLHAVETLPRPLFVLPQHKALAWGDYALPIQCGQSITPPALVALIAERLAIDPSHRVLEIGTGSGYMAGVLARLCKRVFTLDRWRTLITEAEQRLRAVSVLNVTMMVADGAGGWPTHQPFDRIVTTAAMPSVSEVLLSQLAPGGRMVAAIGPGGRAQPLMLIEKDETGIQQSSIAHVMAAPLLAGTAARL